MKRAQYNDNVYNNTYRNVNSTHNKELYKTTVLVYTTL